MLIDWDTANNLELVRSSLDFSSKNSLYGEPKPAFMTRMAFGFVDPYVLIRGDEQDTYEDGWKAPAIYYTSARHRQVVVARQTDRCSFCALVVEEILENRLDVVEGDVHLTGPFRPQLKISCYCESTELLENDALRKALKTTLIGIDNVSWRAVFPVCIHLTYVGLPERRIARCGEIDQKCAASCLLCMIAARVLTLITSPYNAPVLSTAQRRRCRCGRAKDRRFVVPQAFDHINRHVCDSTSRRTKRFITDGSRGG